MVTNSYTDKDLKGAIIKKINYLESGRIGSIIVEKNGTRYRLIGRDDDSGYCILYANLDDE